MRLLTKRVSVIKEKNCLNKNIRYMFTMKAELCIFAMYFAKV